MKKLNISEKTFLICVFAAAAIIRLVFVLRLGYDQLSPDCGEWLSVASDIISGKGYGETWRPPGYSTYLAAAMLVFGKSILAFRLLNVLLGSATCVLIYFIGKKVFSYQVGRIASALMCFYPYMIAYTGDLLSETFLTFMIALSVLMLYICSEKPDFKIILATGVILGITSLTKSTVLPFYGIACAWLWWRTKSFKTGLLVGIFTLVVIAPWTVRNYFYYGKFIPVSTAGRSFYLACNDNVLHFETAGEFDTPQSAEMSMPGIPAEHEEILKLPRMEQEEIFTRKANEWLKQNPDKFLFLLKARFLHFWRLYPMMAYKWQKLAAKLTSGVYIPLGILGIFLSYRDFRKTSLLALLFVIFTAAHLPFVVVLRYRVPIDPYIIIFASYTLYYGYRSLKSYATKRQ
ncbi:MAG: glycosyltransferase family 39 protein [Elusimicrobiota bacterium]